MKFVKNSILCLLVLSILLTICACAPTTSTEPETPSSTEDSSFSTEILNKALSKAEFRNAPFSITMGRLVNSAMTNYEITYYTGVESLEKGYVKESQLDESIDINYFYCAVISGDTMLNPSIPELTEYEEEAAIVWLYLNKSGDLQNSVVTLSENLFTCAVMLMTSSY